MSMALLVYIASPYTGNELSNTEFQINVAEILRESGFLPYWPLCSHYWEQVFSHDWKYWMDMDYEWIERCDVLLRLGGNSVGADKEVIHAKNFGIPVMYSIKELFCSYKDSSL
jgi:hypothetical protein